MFLIKRLEQIATDDECRANVHKLVRYPDEVKADDAAARAVQLRRSVEKFMRTGCAMGGDYYVGKDIDLIALFSSDEFSHKNFVLLREWGDDYFAFRFKGKDLLAGTTDECSSVIDRAGFEPSVVVVGRLRAGCGGEDTGRPWPPPKLSKRSPSSWSPRTRRA